MSWLQTAVATAAQTPLFAPSSQMHATPTPQSFEDEHRSQQRDAPLSFKHTPPLAQSADVVHGVEQTPGTPSKLSFSGSQKPTVQSESNWHASPSSPEVPLPSGAAEQPPSAMRSHAVDGTRRYRTAHIARAFDPMGREPL